MKTRTLNLRRETLTELTTAELGSVVGASGLPCDLTEYCIPTQGCTGYYPTIERPCD